MTILRMKRSILFCLALLLLVGISTENLNAQVRVRGYFRKNGTYVAPHVRSAPDGNPYNNYSFPGNYNPNTGTITTGDPLKYLERYYRDRVKSPSTGTSIPPTPGTTTIPNAPSPSPLSSRELDAMPRLPDWVAPEDFDRSRSYCAWLYDRDTLGRTTCEVGQYRTLSAIVLPDYSSLPSTDIQRSSGYCEWLYGNNLCPITAANTR